MSATHAIIATVGRQDDSAMDWVMMVERAESVEELNFPRRTGMSPDRKLAAAVTTIARGELGRQLTMMSSTA